MSVLHGLLLAPTVEYKTVKKVKGKNRTKKTMSRAEIF